MTTTMTRPTSTTCAICSEEFATVWEAEVDNHECLPIHLRVMSGDAATVSDVLEAQWVATASLTVRCANRYTGVCFICLEMVPQGSGHLLRSADDEQWMVRHTCIADCRQARERTHRTTAPTAPAAAATRTTSVYDAPEYLQAGAFHVLDGRYYRIRPVRNSRRTRTQVARIVEHGGHVHVTWVMARQNDRARMSDETRMTRDQAADFGYLTSQCVRCSLPLSDARSVAAGYGETCARTMGWHYPTMDEAAATVRNRQASDTRTAIGGCA